jgi:8-hydroxy-5-deazaflavin:NADPH oxidoreductase
MRIAVIGTGKVGTAVGQAWARAGHDVTFGSRHPDRNEVEGAAVSGIAEALDGADAVLLALPGGDAVDGLLAEHAGALAGRLVLDATNRMGEPVANAAGQIVAAAPDARYVRAFNSLGWENFAEPTFDGLAADLFFTAPAADREIVERLVADVGLRPAYLGADQHAVVDSVATLWFTLVRARGGNRHLAFRVLTD